MMACAAIAATGLLCGCIAPPRDDTEQRAADAVGLSGEAIVFRSDADPLDAADEHPDVFTTAEIVRLSIERSPEVQAALSRVRIAQAEAHQARLLPNPVLSIAVRFTEGGGSPVIDAGIGADLMAVLRRPGAISVADAKLRSASALAVSEVLDVAARAQEHVANVQALEASLAVLEERHGLISRLLELADSRLRVGEGTRLELVTLQTQRVELDAELADREMELADERLALARLIGHPSADPSWTIESARAQSTALPSETECLRIAAEKRPEIQQREWELVALGAERKLADWSAWDGAEIGIDAERDGDWSVGPSAAAPIPLFDTGQASRERATAALVEARHLYVAARRGVVEEVRRAYAALNGAEANLDRVERELLPLQETRLGQAESQYRAGEADVTALLLAEQDLRAGKIKAIELKHRVAIARVRLERAIGGAGAAHRPSTLPTTQPTR